MSASTAERAAASAQIAALEVRGHRVDAVVDGCRVRWRRFGHGALLVLLHGGHGSWLHWVRNVETLAAHHAVWLPDMPGYNDSDGLPAGLQLADRFAALVAALVGSWRRVGDASSAIDLAGFSFGGLVAAAWTAQDAAVRRLVLLGASGHGMRRRRIAPLEDWRSAPNILLRRAALLHNLRVHMLHTPDAADALAEELHERACLRTRFRSRDISNSDRLAKLLAEIDRPTLLAWGEHDVTAHPRMVAEVLCAGRPERNSCVIAGAGHWVQYERAARVNALLLDWLARS